MSLRDRLKAISIHKTATTARHHTIQWTPDNTPPRRVTFEPTSEAWMRTEYEWTGTDWRACGRERITDLEITHQGAQPNPRPLKQRTLSALQTVHRTLMSQ